MVTAPSLPPAVAGERLTLGNAGAQITLYVAGTGQPLLLIHSINAAASAAEVRPLQEHFSRTRRVYCIDLPGYGLSDRPDIAYSPRSMTNAVLAAAEFVRREGGGGAIDALALSLSSEFLARAALESPGSFRSIALVSPTGFNGGRTRRRAPGSDLGLPWLYRAVRGPGWGGAIFRGLTRPSVIGYFLRKTWGSNAIDKRLWDYDVLTARAPGAEYAPLRFLSGFLFSGDIHTVYEGLRLPVWMCHGVRGDFTDYRNRSLVEGRPNWRFATYDAGALPHFEVGEQFCCDFDAFLADAANLHGSPR